jgi:hypothetical protein
MAVLVVTEVVPVLAVKAYFKLNLILIYACSVSRTGHFTLAERAPVPIEFELCGPQNCSGLFGEEINSRPCRGSNQPVA